MQEFSWLLISDLHLKSSHNTWSQNVVLRDMVNDIASRLDHISNLSFIIVSGDLAHSGQADEYLRVEAFLDDLVERVGLTRNDVFIVPGNHDIDRTINLLAFRGAREIFEDPSVVETYLSKPNELKLLTDRLCSYYEFERRFFGTRDHQYTDDGLAFLAKKEIGSLPIGIIGFNSAITCGDDNDERNIVVGDQPMIDMSSIIRNADIRLAIGFIHHPPVWLRDFDCQTFQERVMPLLDIVHRGHLHEAGVKPIATSHARSCLEIAAGAGYSWRQFNNSYSIVTVNISDSACRIANHEYDSHSGSFSKSDSQTSVLELRGEINADDASIVNAIGTLSENCETYAELLCAMITGKVSEVPVVGEGYIVFATIDFLRDSEQSEACRVVEDFISVKNSIIAFPESTDIKVRIGTVAPRIEAMAKLLSDLSQGDDSFAQAVESRMTQAKMLIGPIEIRSDTFRDALQAIADDEDWFELKNYAETQIDALDSSRAKTATYYLAYALAHFDDEDSREKAGEISATLARQSDATTEEYELAFHIHRSFGQDKEAKEFLIALIDGMDQLSSSTLSAAYKFVAHTGDSELKGQIDRKSNNG